MNVIHFFQADINSIHLLSGEPLCLQTNALFSLSQGGGGDLSQASTAGGEDGEWGRRRAVVPSCLERTKFTDEQKTVG